MKKGKLIFWLAILLAIVGLAYVKYSKSKATAGKMQASGHRGSFGLEAKGFVVEYSKLSNTLSANGSILAHDAVQLQPEVSGRVTYLNIKEGAFVSKGTLLMKINDAELKAQMLKLNTQQKIAQSNYDRLAELLKIKGVSQAEYDAAENTLNNIKADQQILQAQIDKTELRAPFSGKLGLRNISLGAYVSTSTIVTTLQDVSSLKMDMSVPERYATSVHVGDKVQCTVAGNDEPFYATIIAIEPQIDELTRNLKIRTSIQASNTKLFPGAYVQVGIKLKELPNSIMIPSSAIIPDDRFTKVVITDSSKAKFVEVEIGERTENEVQITKGLKLGDTVLVTGLLQAKPGMPVRISEISSSSTVK
ncbi:MAG: efflux RND transporter periplasmic adaptor subunit [Chitinophagales bacterium]|nr:efflux RND transporter periplasmic adaptor subunit [Bacteroidota bacterium]